MWRLRKWHNRCDHLLLPLLERGGHWGQASHQPLLSVAWNHIQRLEPHQLSLHFKEAVAPFLNIAQPPKSSFYTCASWWSDAVGVKQTASSGWRRLSASWLCNGFITGFNRDSHKKQVVALGSMNIHRDQKSNTGEQNRRADYLKSAASLNFFFFLIIITRSPPNQVPAGVRQIQLTKEDLS